MANVVNITAGSLSAKLLTHKVDWTDGVRVSHHWPSRIDDGESGKERRSPRRKSMTLTLAYDLLMTEVEAEEFRNLIGGLDDDYLLAIPIPADVWALADWSANKRYDAQYIANFTEDVGGSIHTSVPGVAQYAEIAPVMFGKLKVEARFKAISDTLGRVRMTVEEDSPYTHRVEPFNFVPGSIWPSQLDPNWTGEIMEISKNKIRRSQVGEIREKQIDGQEWNYRYERGASFNLDSNDIGTLLDFWHLKQGRVTSFDAPAWFAPGTTTVAAPLGFKSRFDSETLNLDFVNRTVANTTIRLITLPWESGGSSAYEVPQKVRLFKFEYMSPTPVVTRYTDHEDNITNGDGTWTSAPFEMIGSNTRDLKLSKRPFKIASHDFTGNPLLLFLPNDPDAKLQLTVSEADLDDLENGVIIHKGRIDNVESESRTLKATGSFLGGALDSPFPRFRIGHQCNWTWGSTACGVSKASYKETGTITSLSVNQVTVTTTASDADNYFSNGYIEVSDGLTFERRNIITSTNGTGTQILELDRPLRINGATDAISFWPGCDKLYTGGCTRYNNKDRFGNAPFMPHGNLVYEQPEPGSGGKKG